MAIERLSGSCMFTGRLMADFNRVHAGMKPAVTLGTLKCQNKEAFTLGVFSVVICSSLS